MSKFAWLRNTLCATTALVGIIFFGGCESASKTRTATPSAHWGKLQHGRYGAAAVTDGRYIYVVGGDSASPSEPPVERIDPQSGQVETMPWKLLPRRFHGAVWAQHAIWVFGGDSHDGHVAHVERIDPATGVVEILGSLRVPRRGTTAVERAGLVLIIGGSDLGAEVEIFNPTQRTSFPGPRLPEALEAKAVVAAGQVYAIGGYARSIGTSRHAYVLYAAHEWRRLADLPWPLSAQAMVSTDEFLYSFGDYAELGRVARYNVDRDKWEKLAVGFTPRRHAAAVVLGDQVFVIGGNTESIGSALNTIEAYSVEALRTAPTKP